MHEIAIVRLSALGDVLMLVPLVRTIQRYLPRARITWIISKPAYDFVAGLDGVEFIVIDKPNRLSDYWSFYKRMRARKFDVLLAAQASFRANLLYPLLRATRTIGYDKLRAKDGHGLFINESISAGLDHTLDGFLRFADRIGIVGRDIRWDIPIPKDEVDWALQQLPQSGKPILLVNPAASKPERSWLVERYIAVIQYAISELNLDVVLIGGPDSQDKYLGELIEAAVPVINLIGKTTPKKLLALIRESDALLCPDTGPSHMATAVGTPVIALHAVTSLAVSGPYLSRHLSVDCYEIAVESILKKPLKDTTWGTHVHGNETMALISVDAVIAKLNQLFATSL